MVLPVFDSPPERKLSGLFSESVGEPPTFASRPAGATHLWLSRLSDGLARLVYFR